MSLKLLSSVRTLSKMKMCICLSIAFSEIVLLVVEASFTTVGYKEKNKTVICFALHEVSFSVTQKVVHLWTQLVIDQFT